MFEDVAAFPEGKGGECLEAGGLEQFREKTTTHILFVQRLLSVPSNVSQPPGEVFYQSGLLGSVYLLYNLPRVKNNPFHVSAWFTLTNTASPREGFKCKAKFSICLDRISDHDNNEGINNKRDYLFDEN